jgi:ribosomal protein L20
MMYTMINHSKDLFRQDEAGVATTGEFAVRMNTRVCSRTFKVTYLTRCNIIVVSAPSTYETILHELEKTSKKQDPDSQTVKKVKCHSYSYMQ